MTHHSRSRLQADEAVLFIDRKSREYLRVLKAGTRVHIRNGTMQSDHLIGLEEGRTVYNSAKEPFLMVRPTFAQLIPNLPRNAQVIYPKDIGPILLWGDFHPGARVVEIGVGPGAMAMAILRAIGPTGHLTTYEARLEFAEMARGNVRQFLGESPNWNIRIADAFDGIVERDVDRMVVDLAEPWRLLPAAAVALRPGGVFVGYVPTVLQVKQLVDAFAGHGFGGAQTFESLQRFWHVEKRSVRPEHRMVAHTGFIVVSRRLAGSAAIAATPID
jgi:tRNA (adenine57-N1/adenine58-N1)-methyltransferase